MLYSFADRASFDQAGNAVGLFEMQQRQDLSSTCGRGEAMQSRAIFERAWGAGKP
jgi:hypothetical protein